MIYKALLIAGVVANVIAQLLLKTGMRGLDVLYATVPVHEKIRMVAANPYVWGGVVFYGIGFLLYSIVLSRIELSKAYPVASVASIILVTVISIVLLTETINIQKIVGLLFAIIGIAILLYR